MCTCVHVYVCFVTYTGGAYSDESTFTRLSERYVCQLGPHAFYCCPRMYVLVWSCVPGLQNFAFDIYNLKWPIMGTRLGHCPGRTKLTGSLFLVARDVSACNSWKGVPNFFPEDST